MIIPLLRLMPRRRGSIPWDDLREILHGGQRVAKVQNSEETLPKVSTLWVGRKNVTDDRQTDRRQKTRSGKKQTQTKH